MQVRHGRLWLSVLLLGWGAVAGSWGQDSYPILIYPAPRAATPLEIDGRLDEEAWQAAPLVCGFIFYDHEELAPVQTSFRVAFDAERLYFGVICDEPLADRLPSHPVPRDDVSVFRREAIEIFLDPNHDHVRYFQFGVDAAGSLYDSERANAVWNSAAEAAAHRGEDHWALEFAVSWGDLGIAPESGRVIGINVCRDRYLAGRQWTSWSQVEANFHDPARFGHLVLDPTPEQLGSLGPEFRRLNRRGPLRIFTAEGVSGQAYRALLLESLQAVNERLAELWELQEEEDAATAEELARRISGLEEELKPLTEVLLTSRSLDAHTYARTDQALNDLRERMGSAIWEARLAALLRGI